MPRCLRKGNGLGAGAGAGRGKRREQKVLSMILYNQVGHDGLYCSEVPALTGAIKMT